jgi:hypothetical protein
MENDPTRIDPLSARIAQLRRLFARGLGRKATRRQAFLLMQAAQATAEYERTLADPSCTANDRVRAFNCARQARADMEVAVQPKPKPHGSSLAEYLARTAPELEGQGQ